MNNNQKWEIVSNSGREKISATLVKYFQDKNNNKLALFNICLEGSFWDRTNDPYSGNLVQDYSVLLPQMILNVNSLLELNKELEKWLLKPNDITNKELCIGNGQIFKIKISSKSDLLSSIDKPALTAEVNNGSINNICVSFLIDYTCVNLFKNSLKSFTESAMLIS